MKKQFQITIAIMLSMVSIMVKAQTGKELTIGDDAPELKIEQWLKGSGPLGLQKGTVYVIDLWAVWCGPCVATIPHLNEVQKKYRNEGLEIIGLTNEDKYGNTLKSAIRFVQKKDSIINYKIAWAPVSTNQKGIQGIFVHPWMQQIGSTSLPTAFIVDRQGKIAFIGDPHTIDNVLEDVMHDKHDLSLLKSEYLESLAAAKALEEFKKTLEGNNIEVSIQKGKEILDSFRYVKAVTYLGLSSGIAQMKSPVDERIYGIGLTAAQRGAQLTNFESPGYLDVLASFYAMKGNYLQAVITEKLAVSISEGNMQEAQKKNLQKYIDLLY